jgi:hypothetical protein
VNLEGRHAGVLADCAFVIGGLVDIDVDDRQGLPRPGVGRFEIRSRLHGGAYVGRKIGRRLDDEFQHAREEFW